MSSSFPRHGGRTAFSMVEVLLVLGILAVGIVPILSMYNSTHRVAHSAYRLTEVTLHAQAVLEALAELRIDEFPPVPPGEKTILLADDGPAAAASDPHFAQVEAYFKKKPPLEMARVVTAERLATGEMLLRIEVKWRAVVGEDATMQTIVLPMLATPRNWQ